MEAPATITSALGTAFTSVSSDVMSAITTILPIALGIVGAFIVVKLGIKFFKSVSGK